MMTVLRTPDDRFDALADFEFRPNYLELAGTPPLRLHYLDEGPKTGPAVLLMHGEPSWCYLYRHMIPRLAAAGCRVLAPDLIGFGRSDKPAAVGDYTYERHVAWMTDWLKAIDAAPITLFCQDWGGLIGLRLVAAEPDRFEAVVAANTALPAGTGMNPAFADWRDFSQSVPVLPVGQIIQSGCRRMLTEAEIAAYDAPFPDERFKAGARQFPMLVPVTPDHPSVAENQTAWQVLSRFDKPFVTAFGDSDPVTAGVDLIFQSSIAGAAGQNHVVIENAGHFLQEDGAERLAQTIIDLLAGLGRLSAPS